MRERSSKENFCVLCKEKSQEMSLELKNTIKNENESIFEPKELISILKNI